MCVVVVVLGGGLSRASAGATASQVRLMISVCVATSSKLLHAVGGALLPTHPDELLHNTLPTSPPVSFGHSSP